MPWRSPRVTLREPDLPPVRLERMIAVLVAGHAVLELPGVGILTAARLVGEVGEISRLATSVT